MLGGLPRTSGWSRGGPRPFAYPRRWARPKRYPFEWFPIDRMRAMNRGPEYPETGASQRPGIGANQTLLGAERDSPALCRVEKLKANFAAPEMGLRMGPSGGQDKNTCKFNDMGRDGRPKSTGPRHGVRRPGRLLPSKVRGRPEPSWQARCREYVGRPNRAWPSLGAHSASGEAQAISSSLRQNAI